MRLLKLALTAAPVAAAAYAYKRFVAGRHEGREETASAEPFSSETLGETATPVADAGETASDAGADTEAEGAPDTLTQPTWLRPADADAAAADDEDADAADTPDPAAVAADAADGSSPDSA